MKKSIKKGLNGNDDPYLALTGLAISNQAQKQHSIHDIILQPYN